MKKVFYLLYLLSAIVFVVAFYSENNLWITISKPIPVILLIILVPKGSKYNWLITIGLVFSLAGDILLMKTVNLFLYGLISFLVAHLFYIGAFIKKSKKHGWLSALPFLAYGLAVFLFLRSSLGNALVPVAIYIFVICTMLWRAFVQRNSSNVAKWAFIGAVFFTVSDTMIATYRFYELFFLDRFFTILTYWTAQFLIYLSTLQKK
jgi:alkenylglycerophosphocholine hydrolase